MFGQRCAMDFGATILGSSLAFIDSTVVNDALLALQTDLNATVVDVHWIIEAYALLLPLCCWLEGRWATFMAANEYLFRVSSFSRRLRHFAVLRLT